MRLRKGITLLLEVLNFELLVDVEYFHQFILQFVPPLTMGLRWIHAVFTGRAWELL